MHPDSLGSKPDKLVLTLFSLVTWPGDSYVCLILPSKFCLEGQREMGSSKKISVTRQQMLSRKDAHVVLFSRMMGLFLFKYLCHTFLPHGNAKQLTMSYLPPFSPYDINPVKYATLREPHIERMFLAQSHQRASTTSIVFEPESPRF